MLVTFTTDRSIGSTGFEAAYQTIAGPTVLRLNDNAIWFTSPNYPNNYENNIQKSWLITANPGKKIQLRFNQFDTELAYDRVKVESKNKFTSFFNYY
jgi:CUB domain